MKKRIKDALALKRENAYEVPPSATVVISHVESDLFKEFENMVASLTEEAVRLATVLQEIQYKILHALGCRPGKFAPNFLV